MGADGEAVQLRLYRSGPGSLEEPAPDERRAHRAAHGLALERPEESAKVTFTTAQAAWLFTVLAAFACLSVVAPTVAGLSAFAFFAAALVFRCFVFAIGHRAQAPSGPADRRGVAWPVYTLLIALKDEAASAPQLAAAIRALDYPQHRLDVKLLIETGDKATYRALLAEVWPEQTELLVLPPGNPRTKPRALNYGLASARGEFVVVYDAEDRPHPDQLKAAVRAFRQGGRTLACVQAPLVGERAKGWLAGQWALEYAIQFGRLLPGLARLGLPIALGGTSNHFRRSHLEAVGGWDPWNVTEDADLGLRFACKGLGVGVIAPPTLEAPPERFGVWVAQRSRWLKGFLQTWLVIMRRPQLAIGQMGWLRFMSMQLTLGAAILSAIVHGPWALWLLAALFLPGMSLQPVFIVCVGLAYGAGFLMALLAPGRKGVGRLMLALSLPIYWPLQTIAMGRAIYGLFRRPHFWAKTPHGNEPARPSAGAPDRRVHSPLTRVVAKPKRAFGKAS